MSTVTCPVSHDTNRYLRILEDIESYDDEKADKAAEIRNGTIVILKQVNKNTALSVMSSVMGFFNADKFDEAVLNVIRAEDKEGEEAAKALLWKHFTSLKEEALNDYADSLAEFEMERLER